MTEQWELWREVARGKLEELGLPETPESIKQVIPQISTEILSEVHDELQKFGLSLKRFKPDTYGMGFSARADVGYGPKKVVITLPPAMQDASYQHKWPEAIRSVRERMKRKGIELDVWS